MSIALSSNFDLSAQLPLDSRTVVTDSTARDAITTIHRYDGLPVYLSTTNQTFRLQEGVANSNWVEILPVWSLSARTSTWNMQDGADATGTGTPGTNGISFSLNAGDGGIANGTDNAGNGASVTLRAGKGGDSSVGGGMGGSGGDLNLYVGAKGTDIFASGSGTDGSFNLHFASGDGIGAAFNLINNSAVTVFSVTDDGFILTLNSGFGVGGEQIVLGPASFNSATAGGVNPYFSFAHPIAFSTARPVNGGAYWIGQDNSADLTLNTVAGHNLNLAVGGTNEVVLNATSFSPAANDGNALGTSSLSWGDLFLASGGVINFNNGNVTLTHSTGILTLAGAFVGRINPRVVSMTDATSFTPTGDTADINTQTNTQSVGTLTANAPSGTPVNGQILELVIKSTNVQTFSWNAIYVGCTTTALPTSTTGSSKTDRFFFQYDSGTTKWSIFNAQYGY